MKLRADPAFGSAGGLGQPGIATTASLSIWESHTILQQRLTEVEAHIRALLETSPDAILSVDQRGRIKSINDAAGELFGYPPHEAAGVELGTILPTFNAADLAGLVTAEQRTTTVEVTAVHKDESTFPVRVYLGVNEGAGGQQFTLVVHDLTEQRILQDQLLEAQRMQAVGRLAGGIAHDFNNYLTVFSCNIELIKDALWRQPAIDPDLMAALDQIQRAWKGASGLTRQLLAFSRREAVRADVLDVDNVVGDMERMLRPLLGDNIRFEIVRHPGIGRIKIDPGHIEKVLMNLAINARDAMPEGGTLRIRTSREPHPMECAGTAGIINDEYLCIAVSDTGVGMDADLRERAFEPFFTTKPAGKGTGLGLSTVDGIVRQAGGCVRIESARGRGTTFKVYLPMVDAALSPEAPVAPAVASLRGQETVLICEEEAMILRLAEHILSAQGYTVLAANNPRQALELSAANDKPIHLLVTDAIMPEMSGPHLAEILSQEHPEMRVLFMSGYTADILADYGLATESLELLEKPLTPAGLLGRIRTLLDRPPCRATAKPPSRPVRVPPARQRLCATR